jgi:hypothetical protein
MLDLSRRPRLLNSAAPAPRSVSLPSCPSRFASTLSSARGLARFEATTLEGGLGSRFDEASARSEAARTALSLFVQCGSPWAALVRRRRRRAKPEDLVVGPGNSKPSLPAAVAEQNLGR